MIVQADPSSSHPPTLSPPPFHSVCIRSIVGHAEGATTSRISLVSLKGNPDATDPSAGYEAPLNPSMFDSQVVDIAAFTGVRNLISRCLAVCRVARHSLLPVLEFH